MAADDEVDAAADEHAELERLRAEVAELRARDEANGDGDGDGGDGGGGKRHRGRNGLRWVAVGVLIVLAAHLTIVAVVARYARGQVLDTDKYVVTVAPVGRDPAVQRAISARVSDAVLDQIDVREVTQQALDKLTELGAPEIVGSLAVPLANQVESYVRSQVDQFVHSDKFLELWDDANRRAHSRVVAVLTGRGRGAVQIEQGQVTLDLATMIETVKQRLVDRGFGLADRIPEVHRTFVLVDSDQLLRAQRAVRLLDRVATVMPFVVIGLVVAAVFVAPNRRRGLLLAALGVAGGMVLLALILALARNWFLDNARPENMTPQEAVGVIRTVLDPLRIAMRAVLALALVIALAAFLTGPSGVAVWVRSSVGRIRDLVRGRVEGERQPSAVEAWIGAHKMVLRLTIVGLAVLLLATWSYPSGAVVLGIVLVVLALLAIVELVGWNAPAAPTPTNPAA
jgi:hypothetical protein